MGVWLLARLRAVHGKLLTATYYKSTVFVARSHTLMSVTHLHRGE